MHRLPGLFRGSWGFKSLTESHPVRGSSQPRTGNPQGVQITTSLLSRKELGWSKLRLRAWPWCPVIRGTHAVFWEAQRASRVAGSTGP